MATKWKNFTRSCWVKAAVYILIAALTGLSAWKFSSFLFYAEGHNGIMNERMLFQETLPDEYLIYDIVGITNHLIVQADATEENAILAGEELDETDLALCIYEKFTQYFHNMDDPLSFSVFPAEDDAEQMTVEQANKIAAKVMQAQRIYDDYEAKSFVSWLMNNPGVEQACREELIAEQLTEYTSDFYYEDLLKNYDYYIYNKASDTVLQNIGAANVSAAEKVLHDTENYPLVCTLNSDHTLSPDGPALNDETQKALKNAEYEYLYAASDNAEDIAIVALRANAWKQFQSEWAETSRVMRQTAVVLILCVLFALFGLLILCFGAGRRYNDDGVYLHPFDRIWTEVQLTAAGCIIGSWVGLVCMLVDYRFAIPTNAIYGILIFGSIAAIELILALIMSQFRRIKAKKWLDGFIILRLFRTYVIHAVHWLVKQFQTSPLRQRVIILAVLLPLACCFWFTIPFIIAGLLYFGMRSVDNFETISDGAQKIRSGKTDAHITLTHGSRELCDLADNLNGISDGLSEAVNTAVKSERLKAELISNVSHDIKTPLTSIITYIDLLKKCNLTDPTAREYIDVLDQKAQRLRTLTGDLFDASKASSGAMKIHLTQTDFDSLLRQAVGERSEHLEKAQLDVRIRSTPPVYVSADGRLLWRILDNLLSNCARYALPGSRVYITIEQTNTSAVLTMKNISANELNISSDELMERFTRGDRSRHTEGSGLGLSIARSLAELMHGSCHVEIDGDLFKAVVSIPTWTQS